MKTIAVILLLSCCALGQDKAAVSAAKAACGPLDAGFEVMADDSQRTTAVPEDGKALIYVVQETYGSTRFSADGKWLGALKAGTYFVGSVDPGERHLCAISRVGLKNHLSLHDLKAEAGKTYYFAIRFTPYGPDSLGLNEVNSDEGKYLVGAAKLSKSHPK